jgi:hypothetical protein
MSAFPDHRRIVCICSRAMTNRIGGYVFDETLADLHRARETLEFCESIWRIYDGRSAVPAAETAALTLMQNEAAELIEDMGASQSWFGEA